MTSDHALRGAVFIALALAALLRWCISLHPYSGQGTPPKFGDYEAQRHWMEVTYNLPPREWYLNTSNNDLSYWGLDYPPISAYHSFITGLISHHLNPDFVALNTSRGFESYEHKLFMRVSVFITDFLIYVPAVWWFFSYKKPIHQNPHKHSCSVKDDLNISHDGENSGGRGDCLPLNNNNCNSQILALFLMLVYPGLILIDYGHFQYNNISLGLTVAAIAALFYGHELLASVFYCLSLNYKQMELYHALPFFCYLLGLCFPNKDQSLSNGLLKLIKIGFVVILSFLVIWLPFVGDLNVSLQVVYRLFPLARGVFEDKVANAWCCVNVIYKLRKTFSNITMAKICLGTTLTAVLPSSIDLLLRPNLRKFLIALINSSLAFFLFSFQVHEKSILLAAIPVNLYLPVEPLICFWFLFISSFSMLPLFIKDGLFLAYCSTMSFYAISAFLTIDFNFNKPVLHSSNTGILMLKSTYEKTKKILKANKDITQVESVSSFLNNMLKSTFILSMTGCVILTLCICSLQPPTRYPHLYPLLISMYSAGHFILFFLYFNYRQFVSVTR